MEGTTETPTLDESWVVVHEQEQETVVTSETQGEVRVIPASYRAEKYFDGTKIEVSSETEEGLAEAAAFIDAQQDTPEPVPHELSEPPAAVFQVDAGTGEQTEVEVQAETVITEEGRFLESDWAGRARTDTIVDEEGQQTFGGAPVEIADALAQTAEDAADAEITATEDPHAGVEAEQIVYDTADTVDSPGQSSGGTIIVPEGIETLEEASVAMDETSQAVENERVAETPAEDTEDTSVPEATPAAVTAAEDLGINLEEVEGTGTGGRVTKADVEQHAAG